VARVAKGLCSSRWKTDCEEFWSTREDAAEAKLAKAVGAIRVMMDEAEYPDEVWKIGSAVLVELDQQKETNATA
jgi:hypothetical protein